MLKLDQVKIWAETTKNEMLVLSETLLKKSVADDVAIEGYKDRKSKGGGFAVYIK